MIRKRVLFTTILFLLVVTALCSPGISQTVDYRLGSISQVYRVHNMNTSLNYERIQEAIDAPETLSGHKIFVDAGTYYESVLVYKAVSLVGADRDATVIDGNGSLAVVNVVSSGVSVCNFTVVHSFSNLGGDGGGLVVGGMVSGIQISNVTARDNNADWGVHLTPDSHDVNVTECVIVNNSRGGLLLNTNWNVNVYNNTIVNSNQGIVLMSSDNNTISHNKITGNKNQGLNIGGSRNSIFGNEFSNNAVGISVQNEASDNNFSDNIVSDTVFLGYGPCAGVYFSRTSNNRMRNNILVNNSFNFVVDGDRPEHYVHDIDTSNLIDGKPMLYLLNQVDLNVTGDWGCIVVVNSTKITVKDLVATRNGAGVLFACTNSSTVQNVTAVDNGNGISLVMSKNNTVIDNNVMNNVQIGIGLTASGSNTLRNNAMTNNTCNFGLTGTGPTAPAYSEIVNDVDTSNTVDGKPIYYLINESNRQIPTDAGCVLLLNSTKITVRDLSLEKNVFGVAAAYSTNVLIENVTVRQTSTGAALVVTDQCTIRASTLSNNLMGVLVQGSFGSNIIADNKILGTKLQMGPGPPAGGILVSNSADTLVGNNTVAGSPFGILLMDSTLCSLTSNNVTDNDYGIVLQGSQNVNMSSNSITNSTWFGIFLAESSANNSVTGNRLTDNGYGIYVYRSSNYNSVYENNLTSNFWMGICIDSSSSGNIARNNVTKNAYGIFLYNATGSTVFGNSIVATNQTSIILMGSSNNNVSKNDLANDFRGIDLGSSSNNNNVVANNITASSNNGINLAGSWNNSISENSISGNNEDGIELAGSWNNTIRGNDITNNPCGIHLHNCFNSSISGNKVTANFNFGVCLVVSSLNTVSGNNVTDNGQGIHLNNSFNNTISGNSLTNNTSGIELVVSSSYNEISLNGIAASNASGIHLFNSSGNSIYGNAVTGNGNGISLDESSSYNDMLGNNVTANANNGIDLARSSNHNSISKNNVTANNGFGIVLTWASFNAVFGNNASNNSANGLHLHGSSNNNITGNDITRNSNGVCLYETSDFNNISENSVTTNVGHGIFLSKSSNCSISGNNVAGNMHGISSSNSADNNRISENHLTSQLYFGIALGSSSNVVSGNSFANNSVGIFLSEPSTSNRIFGNNITTSSGHGIYLGGSSNNDMFGNSITHSLFGISLDNSSNNSISGNNMTANTNCIALSNSSANTISRNNLANNSDGISLSNYAAYNRILENNITANSNNGIAFDSSSNNSIIGNNITANNLSGFYLYRSSNNTFCYNNIVHNALQVYVYDSANVWDDGVEGNYWSNYTGVDPDHDGIGNSLHEISQNNTDRYPLMGMFHSFDTSLGCNVNVVSNSSVGGFEYSAFASSIRIDVSNSTTTQDYGFCRVCIPHVLINASEISVTIDDGAAQVLHFNEATYDNGTHRWIYFAYEHSTHKVVIQCAHTTPPAIAVLSPENKTYNVNNISLTFTVDEPISWVSYSLDGQANVTIAGNTTLTSLPDGSHNIVVYANDTYGIKGSSSAVSFLVDTIPPNVTNVSQIPPEANVHPENRVEVNATITDSLSQVKRASLNYTIGNGTWITVNMTNAEDSFWNATIPAFPYGTNVTYVIRAEDNAGNIVTSEDLGYVCKYQVIPEYSTILVMPLLFITALLVFIFSRSNFVAKRLDARNGQHKSNLALPTLSFLKER